MTPSRCCEKLMTVNEEAEAAAAAADRPGEAGRDRGG